MFLRLNNQLLRGISDCQVTIAQVKTEPGLEKIAPESADAESKSSSDSDSDPMFPDL